MDAVAGSAGVYALDEVEAGDSSIGESDSALELGAGRVTRGVKIGCKRV